MHAWLCDNPIGVEALRWKELPTPTPAANEVLIRIEAASLNFPDVLIVQNKYQMKPALPFVPGSEYAGRIEAVGKDVADLKIGQAVACLSGTGGFGTHTVAPAHLCLPLPSEFDPVDAAAFIMIYATSWHALMDRAQLKAGETVLVLEKIQEGTDMDELDELADDKEWCPDWEKHRDQAINNGIADYGMELDASI